jgi:L-arabinose transport system permease protein
MWALFLLLFVLLSLTVPNFCTRVNLVALALSISSVGIVACTMLFCMASGDFDLSVEAILTFSGILAAVVMNRSGSIGLGVLSGVLAGGLVGLVNGVIIAKIGINALITTLASLQIVRGLSFIVSDGSAVSITLTPFFSLGNAVLWGFPLPVWIMCFCFLFFGLVFHRTVYGRNTLAIGGNREAARLSGIGVTKLRVLIFCVQGLVTGFAGIVLAARMASGQPNASVGFSLDVISACVLGGVSLSGGVGTMPGVVVGALMMGMVQNAMNLMNVPTFYQYLARGTVLLLAVLFDRLRLALRRRRSQTA